MQEFILSILEFFGKAWWIEIKTASPRCTYYFGPFVSKREAKKLKQGYVEDLEGEGATITSLVIIKCCQPTLLTIEEEESGEASEKFPTLTSKES
ncbi:MAG: DUF1816 domain-containing protein [Halothece sp.]